MKRILFVETGSGFGGSAKYLYELLSRLDKGRFESYVIYSGDGSYLQKIKTKGIPCHQLKLSLASPRRPIISYLYLFFWFIFSAFPNAIRIFSFIKRNKIDLIYLNNELLTHFPSIIAGKFSGAKIVCHNHGLRQLTFLEKRFVPFVDLFICVSEASRAAIKDAIGGKPIKVVLNGLDIRDYDLNAIILAAEIQKIKQKNKIVGMVGRIVEWKGHENFVEAAARVLKLNKNVFFILVGDDLNQDKVFLNRLKNRISDLGIGNNFIFTGWKEDIRPYVFGFDVYVHPSIEPEPFGLTVIEAMALGKPVVASRLGALSEIIEDGKDGYLYEPKNTDHMVEKISRLLLDEQLRQTLGQHAREKVAASFTIENNVQQVQEIIDAQF